MEKIDQQLNNLKNVEFPIHSHRLIMRKINYEKTKPFFFIVLSLLVVNFVLVTWHINSKLVEAEFSDIFYDFINNFALSYAFINPFVQNFFEVISPVVCVSFLLNLLGIIYVCKKIFASSFRYRIGFETN